MAASESQTVDDAARRDPFEAIDRAASLPPCTVTRRYMPRFHYELLICGLRGHVLAGLGANEPLDPHFVRIMNGVRWNRCLRCDSWLSIPDMGALPEHAHRRGFSSHRPLIELPLRGRPLRDKIILRIIAIDRAIHFLVLGVLSAAIAALAYNHDQLRDTFYRVATKLQLLGGGPTPTAGGNGFVGAIEHALRFSTSSLYLFATAVGIYALIEGVEAVGLWIQARWAEYLTVVATSVFIPYEIYEISVKLSPIKITAFALNVLIVVYLLFAKRLFGLRGGEAAIHAMYARDLGWQAIERTSPPFVVEVDEASAPDDSVGSSSQS